MNIMYVREKAQGGLTRGRIFMKYPVLWTGMNAEQGQGGCNPPHLSFSDAPPCGRGNSRVPGMGSSLEVRVLYRS